MAKTYTAQNFLNRELGLLEFNRRVLAQAEDPAVQLLERLKYLCIVSSNLDEFFEIRVAGLKEQVKLGGIAAGADGLEAAQILKRLFDPTHQLIARQYQLFNEELVPALAAQGIKFLRRTRGTTLVFVRTKRGADRLAQRLAAAGASGIAVLGAPRAEEPSYFSPGHSS